jgi:chromosome segregation ATPase
MATRRTQFLLVGLASLAAISLWRTVSVEGERVRLAKAHAQLTQTVQQLEAEQTLLNQELGEARRTIDAQRGDLTGLRQELQTAQADLDRTITQLASIKRDVQDVQGQNSVLTDQLGAIMTEKERLEAKLSSIKELKLALHEARRKVWQSRWAAWRARLQAHRHADEDRLASGNRGYVVREGVPTLGASPRMLVHVLEPQTQ